MFEAVRYSKDKEKLKNIMEQDKEAYSKIDSDTKDMLDVVANVKIPERFKTVEDNSGLSGIRDIQRCHYTKMCGKFEMTDERADDYVKKYCV